MLPLHPKKPTPAAWLALALIVALMFGCKPDVSREDVDSEKGNAKVEPDDPIPFGYKCSWLAIKSVKSDEIVSALGLVDTRQCNWKQGVGAAYKGDVFVSPPIRGWTLVVSFSLPDLEDMKREDRLIRLVKALSSRFDEVQYFGTHRVVEYHGWIRAKRGEIVRCYAYLGERGETLRDIGKRTKEENDLGLIYGESKFPSEQDVMSLAGAWSVNPTALHEFKLAKSTGQLGSFPKS